MFPHLLPLLHHVANARTYLLHVDYRCQCIHNVSRLELYIYEHYNILAGTLTHARAHEHPNPIKHTRQYNTNLRRYEIRFYGLLMTSKHYIIDILIDELLYRINTTYVVEGIWPQDVQHEINDTPQQIHKTSKIHTTGTTNSSFVNSMSMLPRLFKYVCPLICLVNI